MRKRNIKSIAHWVIMSVLLLFPVLMVGVSAFANDEQTTTVNTTYEYETNDVAEQGFIDGNIYLWQATLVNNEYNADFDVYTNFAKIGNQVFDFSNTSSNALPINFFTDGAGQFELDIYIDDNAVLYGNISYTFVNKVYFVYHNGDTTWDTVFASDVHASDYLGEEITTVDIQDTNYKQEINNWANGFKNLPVNQWYGNLLDAIGVGATTNSVMNVIYVYPLYVLWVYILDLIVDCLLLIINFGHNALQRLGADNE